ncbi:MAG TPA: phytase, partial [Roseiflexaceae bacterium]|nr:phytase [Roseiflexaceae bacterium]
APQQAPAIIAAVETKQVPNSGDAADDPAIWVDAREPARSLVIGTDKKGGLAIYDLAGQQLDYLAHGNMNNVDLREGFSLGGQAVTLVTASNRSRDTIAIYRLDPATRRLEDIAARPISTVTAYGACMYHSRSTGMFYYIVNSQRGEVEQWRLFDNGAGKVDAARVRAFDIGTQAEGCVADDELGQLYIGEEDVGVWKYGAEPAAGETRTSVDTTSGSRLVQDVEGITIYDAGGGTGYLIVSSQGNNSYAVYRREGNNAYLATFQIANGNGIDGVSQTDGIDVTSANLGPAFPRGMFVAQDGRNDGCNQNFKYVSWESIERALGQTPSSDGAHHTPVAAAGSALPNTSGKPLQSTQAAAFLPIVYGQGC